MHAGWIGAIVGVIGGGIGGIIGAYFSIKNTNSARERAFMVKACAVCWIAIIVFLGLMVLLPNPYRFLLWIPYGILLPLGIIYGNRAQQRIRQEEETRDKDAPEAP